MGLIKAITGAAGGVLADQWSISTVKPFPRIFWQLRARSVSPDAPAIIRAVIILFLRVL